MNAVGRVELRMGFAYI